MPGDPDTVEALARRLGTYAEGAGQAAARLRAIDSGAWVGEAADAFRAAIEEIPAKLERGAGAFAEAAEALGSYAGVLRAAQATAAQVAAMVADADAQSATWSTRRDAYQAALAQAQAIGVPPPPDVPPALDPGAAAPDHAARVLESARGEVAAAAGRSAARLRAAAAAAPNEPGLLSSLWHGVSEFGAGVVEGSWGMATFVFKLSPAYLAIDPEGYAEHLQGLGQGLVYGLTHPVEFAQAVVDWDTWAESPGRALGHLVPDLALTLATGGGASLLRGRAAASRLARAGEKVEKLRSVERTVDKVEDLSDLSAAQRAARLQGKDAYSGVDEWTNRIAQPGERFAVGYPGLSGFGVPEHVLDDVGTTRASSSKASRPLPAAFTRTFPPTGPRRSSTRSSSPSSWPRPRPRPTPGGVTGDWTRCSSRTLRPRSSPESSRRLILAPSPASVPGSRTRRGPRSTRRCRTPRRSPSPANSGSASPKAQHWEQPPRSPLKQPMRAGATFAAVFRAAAAISTARGSAITGATTWGNRDRRAHPHRAQA